MLKVKCRKINKITHYSSKWFNTCKNHLSYSRRVLNSLWREESTLIGSGLFWNKPKQKSAGVHEEVSIYCRTLHAYTFTAERLRYVHFPWGPGTDQHHCSDSPVHSWRIQSSKDVQLHETHFVSLNHNRKSWITVTTHTHTHLHRHPVCPAAAGLGTSPSEPDQIVAAGTPQTGPPSDCSAKGTHAWSTN